MTVLAALLRLVRDARSADSNDCGRHEERSKYDDVKILRGHEDDNATREGQAGISPPRRATVNQRRLRGTTT